ncbi:MAG: hypothetical protein ACK5MV_05195 [Aminipila sp.]
MKYLHNIEPGLDMYLINGRAKPVPTEEYLKYRIDELNPDIVKSIKTAWKKGHTVYHSAIDSIISIQDECLEKAKRYVGYRYLGTYSYLDVFGENAEEEYRWARHEKQKIYMEERLSDMQQQMWEMQKLLLNLSKAQQQNSLRQAI